MSDNRYCPLCGNDPVDARIWCPLLEQPVCSDCDDILRNEFLQPLGPKPVIERNAVISRVVDASGLSLAECAAVLCLSEMESKVTEFRACFEILEYAHDPWSRSMVRELVWLLAEIDKYSQLLFADDVKDTGPAMGHNRLGVYS